MPDILSLSMHEPKAQCATQSTYPLSGRQESIAALRAVTDKSDEDRRRYWEESINDSLILAGPFSIVITIASFFLLVLRLSVPSEIDPALTGEVITVVGAFWFASLSLSITSAFVGLVCKQWIREYAIHDEADDADAIASSHLRLLGMQAWLVPEVVSSVFFALQLSIMSFFVGVSWLLWTINIALAIPLIVVESCVTTFYCITTVWPVILYIYMHSGLLSPFTRVPHQIPWKSPQSLIVLRLSEMISHAISSLCARARSRSLISGKAMPDSTVRARTWRLYDYLWMDLLDRPGLLVKAGPSVHPIVVRIIPHVLRHVPAANQSAVTYHLLSASLSAYEMRRWLIESSTHPRLSFHEVAAGVGHTGLVPRPNWMLVMRLFIDVFPDEEELGKLQVCFKEWDKCGEHGAACSAEFTQAVLLLAIGQGGETGVEHCCRIVDDHLSHAGASRWIIPEGFTMVFERHLNEVIKKVATNKQISSFWDPMDEMLLNRCLRPLLDASQCDLLLDEKRTTFKFLPHIIDYYVARRNHQLLIEVVHDMTKWVLHVASKWPPTNARAMLFSLNILITSRVKTFGIVGDTEGQLGNAVGVMMETVAKTGGAGDFETVQNTAICTLHTV